MADEKKRVSVFTGVVNAINTNRRKKSTIDPQAPGMGVTQTMPTLDGKGGVEHMQQQFLDWQVHKISHDLYTRTVYYDTDRISAYQDFRAMDGTPEIAAAMNIIRDECLTRSEKGNILEVYSENKRIKEVLNDLFKNVLNVDFNLRLWIRDLVKYGDYFVLLQVDKEVGIYDFITLPMEEIHREEGYDGRTSSIRFRWETTGDYFEEWQIAHFRLLEDSKKLPYGRCVCHDSQIDTVDGVKPIEKIKKGDIVSCFDIESQEKIQTKVLDVVNSGKKNVISVFTKHNEIKTTYNHYFLVYKNNEFVYLPLNKIFVGDLLVVSKNIINKAKIKLNKGGITYRHRLLNENLMLKDEVAKSRYECLPEYADEDFAMLFGFLLGDGSSWQQDVTIALGIDDIQNQKYVLLLEKYSNKKAIYRSDKKCKLKYTTATVGSTIFSQFLKNNGFIGKAKTKRFPEWIFKAEKHIQEAFIKGLVDADGCTFVDRWNCARHCVELANDPMIRDLKTLLNMVGKKCGKVSSRTRKINLRGKDYISCTSSLYFYDADSEQIAKHDMKDGRTGDFILSPVISIEDKGEIKDVYDIYVDNENHNFYANGIVVHNSLLDSSRKLWKQLQLAEDAMLVYRLCLDGETRIRTDNGYKYIKDIKIGDKVISYTDKGKVCFGNVINQVNNGTKEVLKITSIHKEIICTKTHPILVNENGVIKYVDAQDLKKGEHKFINIKTSDINIQDKEINTEFGEQFAKLSDEQMQLFRKNKYDNISDLMRKCSSGKYGIGRIRQFLYAKGKSIPVDIAKTVCAVFGLNENNLILSNKGQINSERTNLPKVVDEEFARLFGFMLGDGCLRKHSIQFTGGTDIKQNEYYKNILEKYFSVVRFDRDNRYADGCGNYVVDSQLASKMFKDLGYICGAHNKRIPEWVFNSSEEIRKALILGLCDADGTIRYTENGTWFCTLEMCNKKIIEDVKELWSSIGLSSRMITSRTKKPHVINKKTGRIVKETTSYLLTISKTELPEYENIFSIEEVESRDVYDISVDNEWHNFIANSLPIHNTRAPDRRIFYIEVGNLPDSDVKSYMGKVQNQVRKQPIIDVRTGNMTQKYDPENVTEDYWIPIRGDKSSRVETLPGAQNMDQISDIEYLQNKLFAALQVPKTYLNFSESMPGGSTLSQADIRFSRTINSIQEAILLELRRVANVHLYFLGFEDDLENFQLTLTNPSTQQELLKLETMKARLEVFKEFFTTEATSPSSYTWAMENVLGFSKSDIKLMLKQKKVEKKIFAEIDSAVETYKKIGLFDELDDRYEDPDAAAAAALGGTGANGEEEPGGGGGMGGGGGSFGGGLGGGLDMGAGATPPGEEGGAEAETTPGAEGEETPPEGEEEKPLAESRIVKHMKRSDKRMNNFINDLLGPDEEIIKLMREKRENQDNVLVEKNKSVNIRTKHLLESIDKSINGVKIPEKDEAVQEDKLDTIQKEENADILFENNEKNNQKTKELFDDLDKITLEE